VRKRYWEGNILLADAKFHYGREEMWHFIGPDFRYCS
jgi:hypothetical protein